MIRSIVLVAGLFAAAPAFACAGGACDKAHCNMSAASNVETAMAAVDAAAGEHVALAVSGMTCGSCSDKVLAALKGVAGVNAAAVDHASGQAKIAFDTSKTNTDALIAAVKNLGFDAKLPEKA